MMSSAIPTMYYEKIHMARNVAKIVARIMHILESVDDGKIRASSRNTKKHKEKRIKRKQKGQL